MIFICYHEIKGVEILIKKVFFVFIAIIMFISISACAGQATTDPASPADPAAPSNPGPGNTGSSNLSGSALDVLTKLDEDLKQKGIEMPMTLPPTEVVSEMSQNDIGLTSADFDRLVTSAASSLAAIGTFAHQIAIIQANDASAATQIKSLISGSDGYDAQKWICVWPDKVIVVESGAYVLLAAANADVVDAAIEAFRTEAGTIGTVVTFFEHDGSMDPPAGAAPLPIG